MSKALSSKKDVIEWYWPDFLEYCIKSRKHVEPKIGYPIPVQPTIDSFWRWYIEDGPLGVKDAGRWYQKTDVEYV